MSSFHRISLTAAAALVAAIGFAAAPAHAAQVDYHSDGGDEAFNQSSGDDRQSEDVGAATSPNGAAAVRLAAQVDFF